LEVLLSMLCDPEVPGSTSVSSIFCQMPAADHRLNRLQMLCFGGRNNPDSPRAWIDISV
jgi:hypothetical protein